MLKMFVGKKKKPVEELEEVKQDIKNLEIETKKLLGIQLTNEVMKKFQDFVLVLCEKGHLVKKFEEDLISEYKTTYDALTSNSDNHGLQEKLKILIQTKEQVSEVLRAIQALLRTMDAGVNQKPNDHFSQCGIVSHKEQVHTNRQPSV